MKHPEAARILLAALADNAWSSGTQLAVERAAVKVLLTELQGWGKEDERRRQAAMTLGEMRAAAFAAAPILEEVANIRSHPAQQEAAEAFWKITGRAPTAHW